MTTPTEMVQALRDLKDARALLVLKTSQHQQAIALVAEKEAIVQDLIAGL